MITARAEKIVQNHVILSIGVAAIPIPMLDFIMIYYIQMDMIRQLSQHYRKHYYPRRGKAYVSALVTVTLARMGASFIKAIPGVGSLVGGASSVVLSGASTYALGRVTARFFQDNIELADIDMDLAKAIFKEEFKIGKGMAERMVKRRKAKKQKMTPGERAQREAMEKEIYEELIALKNLRRENLISFEAYEKQRLELISRLEMD